MKPTELKVIFQPSGRQVFVLPGTLLLEAAGRVGIILQTPCGGRGTCGKCKVRLVQGEVESATEHPASMPEMEPGVYLACCAKIKTNCVVDIPRESLFEATEQILTHDAGIDSAFHPVVTKRFFNLKPPCRTDARSDAKRLTDQIGDLDIPFGLLQQLPGFLRKQDWQGTAVKVDHRLIGLEKGDTSGQAYGVAVDLGTTTLVATLYDLVHGKECAVASGMNPQVGFGDDVIARIARIREKQGALAELQQSIVGALNNLLHALTEKAGMAADRIYEMVVAGNATMQQTLCGLDSSALGEVPFAQVTDQPLMLPVSRLGLSIHPGAEVFMFPQIGGFVGGDTVSGMLATGMDRVEKPTLLLDIGTNGEIALAHDGRLEAASTAAGPAFEGARIVQGMRATAGAIEKVVLADDVLINVIGNTRPVGLCGTALIDAVAELLRVGVIEETGRILPPDEAPKDLAASLRERLTPMGNETHFRLVGAEDSASGKPIYLWQKDVRELQLASGAIRAGINILLRRADLEAEDLDAVLLAGAFGNFIRRSNARRIGLLPQVPCERIRFIGNAASQGAKLALLAREERSRAIALAKKSVHVDLSQDLQFQMEFAMAMQFPGNDIGACHDE